MTFSHFRALSASLVALLCLSAGTLSAAERRARPSANAAAGSEVELFDAIKSKQIEVKLIPRDETESRVMIRNNTDQPLTVKLPDAFAGVPVLAQRPGGGIGGNRGGGGNTGSNQSVGGGMGGGMMGGMGGMGMGMMNVPPEQVRQFKVTTVCLEHGKPDPRPGVPYEIRPIEAVNARPEVRELLTAMGKQGLNQRAAQAAAWHLANDMSWEQLAGKRIKHLNGTSEPWFSPQEIHAGMNFAQHAVVKAAEERQSPGEKPSQNQSLSTLD